MIERPLSRETLSIVLLAALSVYVLALLSPAIFNDGDTWWHVRAGEWMLSHHAVLDRDPFSLAFRGKPWETQEWLSEIVMAGAFLSFGWSGVAILTGLAMAAAVALLALYLARHLDPVPCTVVLALAVSCVMPDFLARPHILALPFMTAWIIGLADAAETRRAPNWALLPVMAIWANLHGGFVFGLALIVPFALESIFASVKNRGAMAIKWSMFAAGTVAATLLNPRGVSGLVYPFELMQVKSLSAIGEWQGLDLHQLNMVEVAAFSALFFLIWQGVRLPVLRLLLLLALFHMSLLHGRYGMLFGITGAILIAGPIGAVLKRAETSCSAWKHRKLAAAGFAAVIVACAVVRTSYPIRRNDGPVSPIQALAAVPASLAAEPVFNNYSFGGFLIFQGVRPLVDSRADFYGDNYLADYASVMRADKGAVDGMFRKYHVAWTMLAPGDPLVATLDHRPGWRRLFANRYAIVHAGGAIEASNTRYIK